MKKQLGMCEFCGQVVFDDQPNIWVDGSEAGGSIKLYHKRCFKRCFGGCALRR